MPRTPVQAELQHVDDTEHDSASMPSANEQSGAPGNVSASNAPEKIVFMHIQTTGGTAFADWVQLLHARCARNDTVHNPHYRLDLQDRRGPDYTPVPAGVDTSACGPAQKVCHLSFPKYWAKGANCHNQVSLALSKGCTWVELHHFDISVVNAFREHGFKAITILRDPIERIRSEQVKHFEIGHAAGKTYEWRVKHSEIVRTMYGFQARTPDLAMLELTGCDLDNKFSCARELSRHDDTKGYSWKVKHAAKAVPCKEGTNVTGPDGATLLQDAIRNLNTFDLIGINTHMDKFAKRFAEKYHITLPNLPDIPTVSHYDVEPKMLKLDQQLAVSPHDDKVRTLLDNDLKLFEHGQKLAVK